MKGPCQVSSFSICGRMNSREKRPACRNPQICTMLYDHSPLTSRGKYFLNQSWLKHFYHRAKSELQTLNKYQICTSLQHLLFHWGIKVGGQQFFYLKSWIMSLSISSADTASVSLCLDWCSSSHQALLSKPPLPNFKYHLGLNPSRGRWHDKALTITSKIERKATLCHY